MKGSEEKKALKEALEKSDIKKIPTEDLLKMAVSLIVRCINKNQVQL